MKFIVFKIMLIVTALLPLKAVHLLGEIAGKLLWLTNDRVRKIAEKNIQFCFTELNAQQQQDLTKKILIETGKVALEAGKMWHQNIEKTLALVVESENEYLIKEAQQQGRGVIIAAPHCGSWELVGLYCAHHHAMTSMYAPQTDPQTDSLIHLARQRSGSKLVPTDINGIRAISKALKQAELVGILPDQSPSEKGLFVPFFKQPCYTMTLLPKLAKKTHAVVLYVYAQRLDNSRGFKMIFRPASKDFATLNPEQAAAQMSLDVEQLIREAPHQYQWTYKRFKKRPDGCLSLY